MKWEGGVFCKKVKNGGCFVKKSGKWVFFCKKSGPFLNVGCIMYSISIFILHFTYLGGAYAPNAPPPTGLYITQRMRFYENCIDCTAPCLS